MAVSKPKYKTLRDLIINEMVKEEDKKAATLIKDLRHVKKAKVLTKDELIKVCRWKSPRTIRLIKSNSEKAIRSRTKKAFTTRSEQRKIELLTSLNGVSLPMASAILTLTNPKRYGVIDVRVWQLLYAMESVKKNPKGVGFTFKHWYHYLKKLRYHAKELGKPVRAIEYTLFCCHKKYQLGLLYKNS